MIRIVALIAALAVQDGPDLTLYDRLYTDCARVSVAVLIEDEAQELGVVDEERLATMAESRLRAARLYNPQSRLPALDLEVEALDGDGTNAYTARAQFSRIVRNPTTEGVFVSSTWNRGMFGWFGDRADPADSVHAGVSDFVDEFIRDYLRVNGNACD